MSNRRDIQFTYNPHNKATILDCSLTVASTDASGSGISSLSKSGRIASVFMHSAATFLGDTHTNFVIDGITSTAGLSVGMKVSGTGIVTGTKIASITSATAITLDTATSATNAGVTITFAAVGSPQPAAGYIVVNLQDNYNAYLNGYSQYVTPLSGTPIAVTTGVTAGLAYVITALGTTTTAGWHALGVPANITPAVGVSFIAPATATTTGTGSIQVPKTTGSGIDHIEIVGKPSLMNSNGAHVLGDSNGMQIIMACYKNSVLTAPFDGSAIDLDFYMNNSAQGV